MNLLLFNLATDADDPILGFTTEWINQLAAHFDAIDVITMRTGTLAVAENVRVYSVGKERGLSESRRALAFYRLLWSRLRERRYGACFAHMMPLFAVMGAPLLRLHSVPITLWYTHRQAHRTLALATAASRRVVSAAADSFPLETPKLRPLGHGIDTAYFSPAQVPPAQPPAIVHVARLMPIKHQSTLIRALPDLPSAHAVLIGGTPPDVETAPAYRASLELLAVELGVSDRVTLAGDQPRDSVRDACRSATVAVNLSPPGLFDKAALESMACGVPTITSNPAFDGLHGDFSALVNLSQPDDHTGLANALRRLLEDNSLRTRIGQQQRQAVQQNHSFDSLIPQLVSVLTTGEPQ